MAPESSNLSAPTMAKHVKGKGKLFMMSDLHGGWVDVSEPKEEYKFKLDISAETAELMESLKSATDSIGELGKTWQGMAGSSVGTSGIKYWGGEPVYTNVTPYWNEGSVYKPVSISTPVVEAEYDEFLHTLVMKVSVAVSEYELDQYKGCTTSLGEAIGDSMKKQVVNLLLERNKEQKEKGA